MEQKLRMICIGAGGRIKPFDQVTEVRVVVSLKR